MKKLLCLALAAMLCLALAACAVAEGTWKIAILTGTTSQGEEEFRAAERAQKADPEHIITDTYPDNFMAETETTISKLVAFASDPDVKAIVMCQAVPGAKAAFDKIRAMGRDDMLLIAGVPQEDPAVITAAADFVLYTDEPKQGDTIMETCAKWGVDVFVHYSFPRHLAMETIAARKALLEENAAALGIEYVEATAPDPTGDAGVAGAQQFILEDVPAKLKEYEGKKVAFFTTNCGNAGARFRPRSSISRTPTIRSRAARARITRSRLPSALRFRPGGDDTEALKAIAAVLKEHNALGRYSTWPSPVNMSIIDVSVEYAKKWIAGEITSKNDGAAIAAMFEEKAPGAIVSNYTNADGQTFDNYYTVLLGAVDFNDYAE